MVEPSSGFMKLSECMECANLGENIALRACIEFSEERNLADQSNWENLREIFDFDDCRDGQRVVALRFGLTGRVRLACLGEATGAVLSSAAACSVS